MHAMWREILECAQETWDAQPDEQTPEDWAACLELGVRSLMYSVANGGRWSFVDVMNACGAPLPREVSCLVMHEGGGWHEEIRNVREWARAEWEGREHALLNHCYRECNRWPYEESICLVSMMEKALMEGARVGRFNGYLKPTNRSSEESTTENFELNDAPGRRNRPKKNPGF